MRTKEEKKEKVESLAKEFDSLIPCFPVILRITGFLFFPVFMLVSAIFYIGVILIFQYENPIS